MMRTAVFLFEYNIAHAFDLGTHSVRLGHLKLLENSYSTGCLLSLLFQSQLLVLSFVMGDM